MAKYLDQTGTQHIITKIKAEISAVDLKSVKKVHFDDASRTIKFFKDENALDTATGDFEVIIPDDVDISGLIEKLVDATDGNVVVAKADGTIEDGGVALADLATKDELTQVSNTKVGDLGTLDTTEKGSVVGAINEVKGNIDDLDEKIGDLTGLTTTDKDSVVDAINEIEGKVEALEAGTYDDSEIREFIGTVGDLTTTEKTNLVGAVNELDAEIDTVKAEAKVTIEEDTQNPDFAKVYTVKQNNAEIGKINIPKDMVVQSGQIVEDPVGQAPGKYVELTIANGTGDKIYIAVADLVDAYTAQQTATQVQLAISGTNEISATIVAGSITATELANDAVTTDKILNANVTADKLAGNAVTTDKILDANVTLAKLATDVTSAFDSAGSATAAETNAKQYTDQKFAEITSIETSEIDDMF